MTFTKGFYKLAAFCAIVAAVIMLTIWVMDFFVETPVTMEDAMAMVGQPLTPWFGGLYFAMLFFYVVALWGVTARQLTVSAGLAVTAGLFVLIDGIFEFFTVGLTIGPWTGAVQEYQAADAATQAVLKANLLAVLWGLFNVAYMVAMPCLLIGLLLYGIATWREKGVGRLVSIFFFISFIMLVIYAVSYGINAGWLVVFAEFLTPLVFVVLFVLIAAWLCKEKKEEGSVKSEG